MKSEMKPVRLVCSIVGALVVLGIAGCNQGMDPATAAKGQQAIIGQMKQAGANAGPPSSGAGQYQPPPQAMQMMQRGAGGGAAASMPGTPPR